jgi:hypothetical protein
VIDAYSGDVWTYRYSTLFKPLCANELPPPKPYDEDAYKEGFTGRKEEDFVTWFFKWYWRLDETWSIQDTYGQPMPNEYTWSWFRDQTDGMYERLDFIGERFSDETVMDQTYWDNFWLMYESDYYPTDWLPVTYPDTVDADDDIICNEGFFESETRKCLRCPPGCLRCL